MISGRACVALVSVSFAPQSDDWVNAGSFPRREKTSDEGNRGEDDGDGEKDERIRRADGVKQIADDARGCPGATESEEDAEECHRHSLAEEKPEDVAALRA